MTREESLAFLQSCSDKIKNASEEEIQFYKEALEEIYERRRKYPDMDCEFEFVPPPNPYENESNL